MAFRLRAAIVSIAVFSLLGPPLGMLVAFPRLIFLFPLSYAAMGPAILAGVIFFLLMSTAFISNNIESANPSRRLAGLALTGAVSGFLGLQLLGLIKVALRGDSKDLVTLLRQSTALSWYASAGIISGAVCGALAGPRLRSSISRDKQKPSTDRISFGRIAVGCLILGLIAYAAGFVKLAFVGNTAAKDVAPPRPPGSVFIGRFFSYYSPDQTITMVAGREWQTLGLWGVDCQAEKEREVNGFMNSLNHKTLTAKVREGSGLRRGAAEFFLADGTNLNQRLIELGLCRKKQETRGGNFYN